tara:strand:- start:53468 stop:54115 length:648 start_codon:yes stop_codon:yes gene_type:complete
MLFLTIGCGLNFDMEEEPFTAKLTPKADTFLNGNSDINVSKTKLNLYTWPDYTRANTIVMQFELPELKGRVVKKAKLNLYLTEATHTWCSDPAPEAYRVQVNKLINFKPDLSVASGETYDGVNSWTACTFCNNTTYSIADNDVDGPYDIQILDQNLGWKEWDVTDMVQEWADAPSSNFGLALFSDETKTKNCQRIFASSEHADQGKRPYLTIQVE